MNTDTSSPPRWNQPFRLSHGTLSCRDLAKSRRFYTEFLGLECVHHVAGRAMMLRRGGYWAIVCLQTPRDQQLGIPNHWGLDVESREAVDRARALAIEHKETYDIRRVLPAREMHGDYSFYLEDLDGNWWEFQCLGGRDYDDIFARGDVASLDAAPSVEE
jgi:catechol 2,3-dioxygenase-like lactoylglutathione lyase family enzyme